MASNREERFLERQRGAGARDINLAFDLELPGIPRVLKTPLKPQKSGRSRKTPQPEVESSRSIRKTPKSTKPLPTLSSRRTPATTRQRATKAKVTVEARSDIDDATKTQVIQSAQDVGGALPTQKRKALDDIPETESVTPPKKKRKRKSIGQQSLKKKPRAPLRSKDTMTLPNPILPAQEPELKNSKVTQEQLEEVPKEVSALAADKQNPAEVGKEQTTSGPQRRTQKPVAPALKLKKKPVATQLDVRKNEIGQQGAMQEPPKVESQSESMPLEKDAKLKSRKRMRKAIVQSPSKRRKPTLKQFPLVMNSAANDPVVTSPEERLEPVPPPADIEPKSSKRGRKPRLVANSATKLPEILVDPVPEFLGLKATAADCSGSETKRNQITDNATTPKRKGRKTKSIGFTQKPKKMDDSKRAAKVHQEAENTQLGTEAAYFPSKATTPPIADDRGGENKVAASPGVIEAVGVISMPDKLQSAEVPKKRGRPKKPAAPTGGTEKSTIESLPDEPRQINGTQKRGEIRKPAAHLGESDCLIPVALPDELQPEDVPKKRGRPKKPTPPCKEVKILIHVSVPSKHQTVEAPKKRGRPKKVTLADNAAKPIGVNRIHSKDVRVEEPLAQPSPSTKAVIDASTDPPRFVPGAYAPTASVQPSQQSLSIVRKGGRPKKQAINPAIADAASKGTSISQQQASKLNRHDPKDRAPDAPNLDNEPVARKSHRASHTRTSDQLDPLSDITPMAAKKKKPISRPTNILAKRTRTMNEPDPLSTIPAANPISKAKNKATKPTRPAPSTQDLPPEPTPALDPTDNSANAEHHPGNPALDTYAQQPILSSHDDASQPSLPSPQGPPTQPTTTAPETQKPTNLQHPIHTLSASVKRRKMEAKDFDNAAVAAAAAAGKSRPRRGLEGFVFSRVAKRKGGGGREEEAINPILQDLLSKVKGLGGGVGKEGAEEDGGVVRIC
ncbi:MAG: hypothetical protein Q9197_006674 [Variospora fuerteventurae]